MEGNVRLVGRFSRRVSLSLFKLHTTAHLSTDGTDLFLFKTKDGSAVRESRKCIGKLANVLVSYLGDKRKAEWRISIMCENNHVSQHRFQSDTIEEAQQWVDYMESFAGSTPVIAMLGNTGIGKSQLCTALAGLSPEHDVFRQRTQSDLKPYLCNWFGGNDGEDTDEFILINSPKFSQSRGSRKQIADFARTVQNLGRLNALLLVVDAADPTLDRQIVEALHALHQVLGPKFWSHLCLVFVHVPSPTPALARVPSSHAADEGLASGPLSAHSLSSRRLDAGRSRLDSTLSVNSTTVSPIVESGLAALESNWASSAPFSGGLSAVEECHDESILKSRWFQLLPREISADVAAALESIGLIRSCTITLRPTGSSAAASPAIARPLSRYASFRSQASASEVCESPSHEWLDMPLQQQALDRLSVIVRTMPSLVTKRVDVMQQIPSQLPETAIAPPSALVSHPPHRSASFSGDGRLGKEPKPEDPEGGPGRPEASGRFSISRLPRLGSRRTRSQMSWRASRDSFRDSEMDDALHEYLKGMGLDRHFGAVVSQGIYKPEELLLVPDPYLAEMGFSPEEIDHLKPQGGFRRWHAFEDSHDRLLSELETHRVRCDGVDQLTTASALALADDQLPRYFPRVKDRLRFIVWRHRFMANRVMDGDAVPLWAGALVQRGPDWRYDSADIPPEQRQDGGGKGCPGRVLAWHRLDGSCGGPEEHVPRYPGWVRVRWLSNGKVFTYRAGPKKAELVFLARPDEYRVLEDLVPHRFPKPDPVERVHRRLSWAELALGRSSRSRPLDGGYEPLMGGGTVAEDAASLQIARLRSRIHLGMLRCSFLYPLGENLVQYCRFDIRDEICLAVGGLRHGQVVTYKLDGTKHIVVGVATDNRRIRMYFQPKEGNFMGAGMFPNATRESFEVVGREELAEARESDEPVLFDDKTDNDVRDAVCERMRCDFPYLCGTQYARVALFDTRDEVCTMLGRAGLRSGDTLCNRENGMKIWVVGAKLDQEGVPRLWFHTASVVGCGTNQGFHPLQYRRVSEKTALRSCTPPIEVTPDELALVARSLQAAFAFPRCSVVGGEQQVEDIRLDVRPEVAQLLCGYSPGTVFIGPDGARVTVVGVGLGEDRTTPQVYFYIQDQMGATVIPDFNVLQHYFRRQSELKDITVLRRELEVRNGGSNRAMVLVQNLLHQQEVVNRSREPVALLRTPPPSRIHAGPVGQSSALSEAPDCPTPVPGVVPRRDTRGPSRGSVRSSEESPAVHDEPTTNQTGLNRMSGESALSVSSRVWSTVHSPVVGSMEDYSSTVPVVGSMEGYSSAVPVAGSDEPYSSAVPVVGSMEGYSSTVPVVGSMEGYSSAVPVAGSDESYSAATRSDDRYSSTARSTERFSSAARSAESYSRGELEDDRCSGNRVSQTSSCERNECSEDEEELMQLHDALFENREMSPTDFAGEHVDDESEYGDVDLPPCAFSNKLGENQGL